MNSVTARTWNRLKNRSASLLLLLPTLLLGACSGSSGPVEDILPEGIFHRVEMTAQGEIHHGLRLEPDSAFLFDTTFVMNGSTLSVDSIRILQMELNPSADGYFRAVEEERGNGSDITGRSLRYWYFYQKGEELHYYRGMRFRGANVSIVGDWSTSAADSAYLERAYNYSFTDDSVRITTNPGGMIVETSYEIHDAGIRTLSFTSGHVPPFGPRMEIVPGLALYLTSEASPGYRKIGSLPE